MFWRISYLVLWVLTLSSCDDISEWREVQTTQGVVRGKMDPEGGLYIFYNIPYATVPKGADRFKAPLPGPVWSEPLDAIDRRIICLQAPTPLINVTTMNMQEECLVVNVYVPDTDEKKLPVIVFVHGGGFEIGFGEQHTSKRMTKDKKVITVSFNYRLGVHGFLCLGTKDVPGNAGVKDQIALLQWVKKNIGNFGGNPDDITVSGGSAGSISLDLLTLSKATEGLFHKVIPESGVGVASISVQIDPIENAKYYAKKFNFNDVDDFYALQDFYKNTPLKDLFKNTFMERTEASNIFSPCIEKQTGGQVFLDDSPVNILKKGNYKKVPILIGFSEMEGFFRAFAFETIKDAMNEKFSNFLPPDLQFKNEEEKEEVAKRVKEFYFGDQPVREEKILDFVNYFSDILFTYPTVRSIKLRVEAGEDQIYLYEYSFVDESAPVVPYTNVRAAVHCAQTLAIFDGIAFVTSDESSLSDEYKQMKATMRELWSNFAIHGKPVPEGSSLVPWPPAGAQGGPYMSLNQPMELHSLLHEKRVRFWDNLYQKYYREPAPPQPPPKKQTEL